MNSSSVTPLLRTNYISHIPAEKKQKKEEKEEADRAIALQKEIVSGLL